MLVLPAPDGAVIMMIFCAVMADYAQRYFFGIVADGRFGLCANLIFSGGLLHRAHGVLRKLNDC
jgi:hypothetical protein